MKEVDGIITVQVINFPNGESLWRDVTNNDLEPPNQIAVNFHKRNPGFDDKRLCWVVGYLRMRRSDYEKIPATLNAMYLMEGG